MSRVRTHAFNAGAVALALALCLAVALSDAGAPAASEASPDSPEHVVDADQVQLPVRAYERILSLSPIADAVLLETIPSERLLGLSGSMRAALGEHRFANIRSTDGLGIEEALGLNPDLVIVSGLANVDQVRQLRAAGVAVFRLGSMRGLATFEADALHISRLLNVEAAGRELVDTLKRRMRMVAADVAPDARPRGLYLGVLGGGLYGGANHTSYHDVMEAAGLVDATADLDGWPAFTPEEVLTRDPDVILVHEHTRQMLCERQGLDALRACRGIGGARIIELPSALLNDPGLGMLRCAELLRDEVHGPPTEVNHE